MDKSYKIVRNFGFKGIMSNAVDNIIPQGYVPDMKNMTVSMEGLAQNIKTPSELSLYWENWEAGHPYILNDVIKVTFNSLSYFLICETAGTSGATEPDWNATFTDGGVSWGLGEKTTDPITSFYHFDEWTEIYAIQIGACVVLFEGINQATGYRFSDSNFVSFASGASNDNYLYIMHYTDGLFKYTHPLWTDVSTPTDDPITVDGIDYSGGTPPFSEKIFAYKNRLWAYGWLKEGLDLTGAVSRIHWSEISSLPENHVIGTELVYTENPEEFEYTIDDTTKRKEWANTVDFTTNGNIGTDYFDPFYFIDVSSTGDDVITGIVPYEQALYIFTPENVYNLTFYTTYDVTCQQIASNIDGIPKVYDSGTETWIRNFITAGKGIYYIGSKGLYAFATPTPVKISQPVQNLIDLVIDDPKGVAYFNDRVYFALSDEVWVFDVVRGTWEKYVYPFQIETIYSSDHIYATTTTGDVYELDTEDSTYLSWYMDTPKIDLGNLYAEKRPEDIVAHFKIPTASSTMTILMTDEEDVDTNVATSAETFITGRTGLLNELHEPIYKDVVKAVSFKLSGSGEIKLLGYDINFKVYHRKRI